MVNTSVSAVRTLDHLAALALAKGVKNRQEVKSKNNNATINTCSTDELTKPTSGLLAVNSFLGKPRHLVLVNGAHGCFTVTGHYCTLDEMADMHKN